MTWQEVPWWLPSATVAALAVLAVVAAASSPRPGQRKYWLAAVLLAGLLAIAGSVRQQARSRAMLAGDTRRLHELTSQLDAVGRLLPTAPHAAPGDAFAAATAGITALKARITQLEGEIRELRKSLRGRSIASDTATRMVGYLRRAGAHRVVVSCLPDDAEAFAYANQLVNVLRRAGWEALGPEKTTIFGDAAAMGIKLYVRGGDTLPAAAKVLTEAFTRFNIPYQSGITPNDAIPDPATVELFVGPKS